MQIPYVGEDKALDERARALAPGEFLELSLGQTHFSFSEEYDGDVIVFVHGIAGPMAIWKPLIQSLQPNGFRILIYDLYGRGYSDRLQQPYDIELFVGQLRELLTRLDITVPVTLVGWSLGAMVSAAYAALYPDDVGRLVFIAPAGVKVTLPITARLATIPGIGELIVAIFGRRIVLRSVPAGLFDKKHEQELIDLLSDQMQYRGYLTAFLSTLRLCAYKDASDDYRAVAENRIPAMMILGSRDQTIPAQVKETMRALMPQIVYQQIESVGHFPHFESPAEVEKHITDFMSR